MHEAAASGLALVFLAGIFQGSFMLPAKGMRGWAWENYWLIFAVTAYLICPWLLVLLSGNGASRILSFGRLPMFLGPTSATLPVRRS